MSAATTPSGPGTAPVIEAVNLQVTLGGLAIVRGVDLEVPRGEVLAVLGANGSGKSTLIRSLLGAVPLSGGSVRLFGEPLGPGVPWMRVGYVPQRVPVASGMPSTALEVVRSGLLSGRSLRPPRDARTRALAALDEVGMAGRAGQRVQEMSGGQQQRVQIARALVRRPDLLVLDEPTSGIDLPTQEAFVSTVRRMHENGGTVVVVLHELGEFGPLIQRSVVLRHGRVVHDGVPPVARVEHAGPAHDHAHAHGDPPSAASGLSVEVTP